MDTQTKHKPLAVWISHKPADGTACVPEEVWRVHVGNHEGGAGFQTRLVAEAEAETWRRLLDRVGAADLLAAARLLVALEDADADDADTRWKTARRDLRAAIAKAEGK